MPEAGPFVTEPAFAGRVGTTVADSDPWWGHPASPPGRPNVIVILLDDVGFAQLGCYGSSIRTPAMDSLARGGVRYRNFHVPALCSPTRASLLTGRNHHAVGMGFLSGFDTGYPGYRGAITPAAATIAETLRSEQYGTYAVGKWHLIPPGAMSPAGPFDQWPTQRGFDRYYGFLWGEDDQWAPELWYDQHQVDVPGDPDYHLSADLVDRAGQFLDDHVTSRPDDPFFLYLALGACHAPHQAPRRYIDAYRGAFDHGWDAERERVLQRQIELGVVPSDTELAPRNPEVPAWGELPDSHRRLYARLQEAFAGYTTHADEQIGRLVDRLETIGVLDDTVIMLMADNGASGEGGPAGTVNEYRYFLGLPDSIDDALAAIDQIGGRTTHNHYPSGWAQAGNTPLRYYKTYAHGGGVRAPLIISTPDTRAGKGDRRVRTQYHHAIDIAPTVLDLTGTKPPTAYLGVAQMPLHGMSMAYSLADADAPSPRTVQYFETMGNRGIYVDGWKAVVAHRPGDPFEADTWELYDVCHDFAEVHDLASSQPERLAEMVRRFDAEARTYQVYPLDDRMGKRVAGLDPATDRRRYVMRPGTRLLNHVAGPNFSYRSFSVTARPTCAADTSGVLLAYGRRAHGFTVFFAGGVPKADVNLAGDHVLLAAAAALTPGRHAVRFEIGLASGRPRASLLVDGDVVAEAWLPRLLPGGIGTLSVQCGHNAPSAVSPAYDPPYAFDGDLGDVIIELGDRPSTEHDWRAELAAQ